MTGLSTTALRRVWAPACTGPFTRIDLHGEGRISIRAGTEDAWHALNACLIGHDYRTRRADTGAYNCRKITGGTGYSLHAYGIAADLNWQTNPYGPTLVTDMPAEMVDAILRIRTRNGVAVFRWGGNYRTNKDAMHFEIVCTPADLSTGIDSTTVPGTQPTPPTPDPGDDMTPEQEAKLDRALAILEKLDDDYLTSGKGVRQEIAKIAQRTADLVTGRRPGKG